MITLFPSEPAIIPGEWLTTVRATATGAVIITQKNGEGEMVIVIPPEYNFAMCSAIHNAKEKRNEHS